MANVILEQIKSVFEEKGIHYHSDDEKRIGARFSNFVLMFHVTAEELSFKMYFDKKVPGRSRMDMLEYLNYANLIMKEGHFVLDNEGDIYFNIYTERSVDNYISDGRIINIIAKGCSADEMFFEGMEAVIAGEATPMEAFQKAVDRV